MLYTEYGEIENNNFVLDTASVEVDKDKKEIYSDSSEKVLLKKMFLGLGGGGIKKNKEIAYELWFGINVRNNSSLYCSCVRN